MTDVPYTHGHHDSVLRSHRWRTADNSAGYLLPHLRAGMSLLDVGCGPGTITCDLARRLGPGPGDRRRRLRRRSSAEARADAADAGLRLPLLRDRAPSSISGSPTAPSMWSTPTRSSSTSAIRWPRWSRCDGCAGPGGMVAARDRDYPGFRYFPDDPELDRAIAAYGELTRPNGANWDAGRRLLALGPRGRVHRRWSPSASTWCFATPEDRAVVGRPVGRPVHPVGAGRAAGGPWHRHRGRPGVVRRRLAPVGGVAGRLVRRRSTVR